MIKTFLLLAFSILVTGCASDNYNKDIPIHSIAIGMKKTEIIEKLGKPHRVVSSEVVNGVSRQMWMYQQDKLIWLSGNSFLGGRTRNDQVIYLLGFEDEKLIGWKDNQLQPNTSPGNTFEIRNR